MRISRGRPGDGPGKGQSEGMMAGMEARNVEATSRTRVSTNNLEAFWMPFTANRQFKKAPRMLVGAEGMYYRSADGRKVLDATAGLWCCNAGHRRQKIVDAVGAQVKELDYAPAFQMGHPKAFELAARLVTY